MNSQITEETQQAHRSEERWAVFDGGFIILTRGFEAGIVSFALCTQGIDTLKTQAFPVNGKSVIRGDDPVFNAPPVFLPVIPVFVAAGANAGFGLAERAAVFLPGTIIVGGLAILVHSQPGRADWITGRNRFSGFRAAWIEGNKSLAARRGQLIERQSGDTVHQHMAFIAPVERIPAFIVLVGDRMDAEGAVQHC